MGLEALLAFVPALSALKGEVTVVVDGPLGPNGPPTIQRNIDRECQRGSFQRRAVPASVTGGGRALVDATYRVVDALVGAQTGPAFRFSRCRAPGGPALQIFETMPTVGLAVLLPMVSDVAHVPSRATPIDGTTQKSDFYWSRGAGRLVGGILSCPEAGEETDHDLRAALYCASVAVQIVKPSTRAPVCIGAAATGTYVLAGPEDPTWSAEITRVGRVP
ncbi:MAG: hypothetical protein QM723_27500 [Myxococcaceae bacterium]